MSPLATQAARVVRVLRAASEPMRQSDVIAATYGDTLRTWQALKALMARGVIRSARQATGRTGRRPIVYWMEA